MTSPSTKTHVHEHGQSIAEMAILFPFLLILLIAIIEFAQVFTAYIGLINAAREGAVYASLYPDLSDETDLQACTHEAQSICDNYVDRIKGEAVALNLDVANNLTILPPTRYGPNAKVLNCPITSTVVYRLSTFTSNMSLPLLGRLGLPSVYTIRYSAQMPIRNAATFDPTQCP